MRRLHIVGCPRSGTTLLLQLLTACYEHGGHCEHEASVFVRPPEAGSLYISKQPNDIRRLRHIFFRDSNLYIVCAGRDPRAVVTSIHPGHPDQYFCNYRIWRACDRAAQRYRGHHRFHALRYEELVRSPDAVQAALEHQFAFLRRRRAFGAYRHVAQPSPAAADAMGGLRDIGPSSLEKWRSHLPRLAHQYQRHPAIADDLVRLGYEPDHSWLSLLAGVPPQVYPCRYPEHPRLADLEQRVRVYLKSRRYLKQQAAAR